MHTIEFIENYITFLTKEYGLSITLHTVEKEQLIAFSRLMYFNIHDNPYCNYVKSSHKGHVYCRKDQKKLFEKCTPTGNCHICHAGIYMYVYPIFNGDKNPGFISVSGYACPEGEKNLIHFSKALNYPPETVKKLYGTLKNEIPSKKQVDTLIIPLCQMLELAYIKGERSTEERSIVEKAIYYTRQQYFRNITSEEICQRFHCSRSQFSHAFKKKTGKTFREYLTALRINQAKKLLIYSTMKINEIAIHVGFNDANYFYNVFRRYEGISPLEFRKSHK